MNYRLVLVLIKKFIFLKINSGRDYVELEKKTNKNCQKLQKKYPNALIIKKVLKDITLKTI